MKKIRLIRNKNDKGLYHAMNVGIKNSSGQIIGILNSLASNTNLATSYSVINLCEIYGDRQDTFDLSSGPKSKFLLKL